MIEIREVSKRFGRLQVLDQITASLGPGECVALIGPNGSGKTTLIKSILGMVVPDSGTIEVMGERTRSEWKYRDHIGYMPQIGRYPEHMTIGQVIAMIRDLRGSGVVDTELPDQFGLWDIAEKGLGTLSGGTRQKVSASLAFLFNPPVLILDEPTAGLDPVASEVLKEKIRKEKEKGKLILLTSHVMSDFDDLVSRVIYIQDGRLLYNDTIEALRAATGEDRLSRAVARIMKKESA